jgi:NAD(P) transhydrogenase subunit alpha
MKPHYYSMLFAFVCLIFMPTVVSAAEAESASETSKLVKSVSSTEKPTWNRGEVLVVSLTVFILAVFVGFEIIAKVPPTLHTPLMSGSNAISGITVIGAVIAAGQAAGGLGSFLGLIAVVLSMINVVGGFWVTHRMLLMFKRR